MLAMYVNSSNRKVSTQLLGRDRNNLRQYHYTNKHEGCLAESRCKMDPDYEFYKQEIEDSDADRIVRTSGRKHISHTLGQINICWRGIGISKGINLVSAMINICI